MITDTVGFIRDLPKALISAFNATLEELHEGDLLIHVVDISDARMHDHIASVTQVLEDIDLHNRPRILVFNKTDLLEPAVADNICRMHGAFGVSALDRASLRPLLNTMEARLWQSDRPSDGP